MNFIIIRIIYYISNVGTWE